MMLIEHSSPLWPCERVCVSVWVSKAKSDAFKQRLLFVFYAFHFDLVTFRMHRVLIGSKYSNVTHTHEQTTFANGGKTCKVTWGIFMAISHRSKLNT